MQLYDSPALKLFFFQFSDLTAIANVAEVVVTDETIKIQWDPLIIHGRPDISYTVQWHASDGGNSPEENSTAASAYTIPSLNPYTKYAIRVRAHSGQETGNWSDELFIRTKAGGKRKDQIELNVKEAVWNYPGF